MTQAAFPDLRLRRTRRTGWSRAMVRETQLTPSNQSATGKTISASTRWLSMVSKLRFSFSTANSLR